MPVTSKDFKLINSTPEFAAQVDRAFDYFRAKYPGIDDALRAAADKGIAIYNNPDGNPQIRNPDDKGADWFGTLGNDAVASWNPASGMLVTTDGHVTGMQSPAMGLLHELLGHGLDINVDANFAFKEPGYSNGAEHLAIDIESAFGIVFGEPLRDNHDVTPLTWVNDVTTHTTMGENGELILTRMGADGKDEYGPQIDYTSSGWQHLESAFRIIIHASVVQQYDNVSTEDLIAALKIVAARSGGTVIYDEHGRPFIHENPPVPGPDDPVIIIDPHNGGNGGDGNGAYGDEGGPGGDNFGNGGSDSSSGGGGDSGSPTNGAYTDNGGPGGDNFGNGGSDSDGGGGGDGSGGAWESGWPGGGDGDAGCVAIASFLPDGRRAGDIGVGDSMELADQHTLERGSGVVSYSQEKDAFGYRIVTESGATLVCSDAAPIPVREHGPITPDQLLGEEVAVRHDKDGIVTVRWEKVSSVEEVGHIAVQHITVGDKCFWAGEQKGAYILHHNMKQVGGGGGGGNGNGEDWTWFNSTQDHTLITPLVGVAPPIDSGMF